MVTLPLSFKTINFALISTTVMKRLPLLLLCVVVSVALNAQTRPIHTLMLEPVVNEDMSFESDSCKISFSYNETYGLLDVVVYNKTGKRAYIEWENARINSERVVFGDDMRITMKSPKSDEAIPSKNSSIRRSILTERWLDSVNMGSQVLDSNPISRHNLFGRGGSELNVIIPVRFGESEAVDYQFKLSIYTLNPADCSQISVGMKAKDVKKLLGKPDDMYVDPWGTANTKAVWYYSSNAIINIDKGVVSEIKLIKRPYMKE